jgi:hypothetical protein
MIDVRISGPGNNLASGICRPVSGTHDPHAKSAAQPRGVILAGVFGCNDIRPGIRQATPRLRIVAGFGLADGGRPDEASC